MTEFDMWLDVVDAELEGLLGMGILDIEDFPYYSMWEDGESAKDVAMTIFKYIVGL